MENRSFYRVKGLVSVQLWTLLLFVMMHIFAYAQGGPGTIGGIITDQTGAAIQGATVKIVNSLTHLTRNVTTGSDGVFVVPFLPVGNYSVSASKQGFTSETNSGLTLTADQRIELKIGLVVGNTAETVQVSAEAAMIQTTDATISQIIDNRTVTELPLNGRDPGELVYQVPGAVRGDISTAINTVAAASDFGYGMPTETASSVNGSREGGVYYVLDGVNNMDTFFNSAMPFPNSDATQEFRVLTNNFDAQYGFAPGAVVSIVTKSGTNDWHGNLFEYLRNDKLDATDYFSHLRDGLKRNQFGGSIGGPIAKGKLFVFGNYQRTSERISQNSGSSFVPSNAMISGDFSYFLTPAGGSIQLHNPDGTPIPGNMIDPSTFSPASVKLLQGLPRTNDPAGLVQILGVTQANDTNEYTLRTDYNPNDANRITFRAYVNQFDRPPDGAGGNLLAGQPSWHALQENFAGNWVWTPKTTLTNDFVFAYTRSPSNSAPGTRFKDGTPLTPAAIGMTLPMPDGVPSFAEFDSAFSIITIPVDIERHSFVISDKVAWSKGKHLLVTGIDVLPQTLNQSSGFLAAAPVMSFDGSVTGTPLSDFLLGDLGVFEQGGGQVEYLHGTRWAAFVQDTYHMVPSLTISAGLRWEPDFPAQSEGGRLADFIPGRQSTRYPNAPVGLVFPGDQGIPAGGYHSRLSRFEPRLGIAWQPSMLPRTSIRAAFGMMAIPPALGSNVQQGSNAPFSPSFQIDPSTALGGVVKFDDPWASFAPTNGVAPFPPFSTTSFLPQGTVFVPKSDAQFILPVLVTSSYPLNFVEPTFETWNLSIEHELKSNVLLRAAYVGSEAYHLGNIFDLNPGYFSAAGARLNYPNFDSVRAYESVGTGSYNGVQFTFEKRFSHGVQLTSNYSYSKNIDDGSVTSAVSQRSRTTTNPFDMKWNRGISSLNFPHVWSTFGVWQLPTFSRFANPARWILGSWELSGIWTAHSGLPFDIRGGFGNNQSLAGIRYDRADLTGQPFNVHQGSKSHWLQQYFNPAAFATNAPGTFGNSPRNLIEGPGWNNVDLNIAKNFPLTERCKLQFRWEMFNAFNRTEFNVPINDPSSPDFGRIVGTAQSEHASQPYGLPRIMQAALKLEW